MCVSATTIKSIEENRRKDKRDGVELSATRIAHLSASIVSRFPSNITQSFGSRGNSRQSSAIALKLLVKSRGYLSKFSR